MVVCSIPEAESVVGPTQAGRGSSVLVRFPEAPTAVLVVGFEVAVATTTPARLAVDRSAAWAHVLAEAQPLGAAPAVPRLAHARNLRGGGDRRAQERLSQKLRTFQS